LPLRPSIIISTKLLCFGAKNVEEIYPWWQKLGADLSELYNK
jgi:hypothetical protein